MRAGAAFGRLAQGERIRLRSKTFEKVRKATARGRLHVSEHAYDEVVDDHLSVVAVIRATAKGEVVEDYPDDARGDGVSGRAILITVYRPDPTRWSEDFRERRPRK